MRLKNENNNKILKFSIRKLSLGAAPVVIGALFLEVMHQVRRLPTKTTQALSILT